MEVASLLAYKKDNGSPASQVILTEGQSFQSIMWLKVIVHKAMTDWKFGSQTASDYSCCKNILLSMDCGELGSNRASQYAEIYNNAVVNPWP